MNGRIIIHHGHFGGRDGDLEFKQIMHENGGNLIRPQPIFGAGEIYLKGAGEIFAGQYIRVGMQQPQRNVNGSSPFLEAQQRRSQGKPDFGRRQGGIPEAAPLGFIPGKLTAQPISGIGNGGRADHGPSLTQKNGADGVDPGVVDHRLADRRRRRVPDRQHPCRRKKVARNRWSPVRRFFSIQPGHEPGRRRRPFLTSCKTLVK